MSEQAIAENAHNELIGDGHTLGTISDKITGIVLTDPKKTPLAWLAVTGVAGMGVLMLLGTITYLVCTGIGIWARTFPSRGPFRLSTSCGGSGSVPPARWLGP